MIKFEIPRIEDMEKVNIRLKEPRNIIWKGKITNGRTQLPKRFFPGRF